MKRLALAAILGCQVIWAAELASEENLQYTINWPSGLSLGEGRLKARKSATANWNFEFQFEAAVPGFSVSDRFASLTTGAECSVNFDKEIQHGKRKSQEKIEFDVQSGKATRQTIGGGKSEIPFSGCARDALAFIFHLRRELAQGRIPAAQNVIYGHPYRVRLEYKGSQKIKLGDSMEDSDRVLAYIKGPASDFTIEFFLGKDNARTPLIVKLPLSLGTFSMELVR